jgi:hypothetical protein
MNADGIKAEPSIEEQEFQAQQRRARLRRLITLGLAWLKTAMCVAAASVALNQNFGNDPAGRGLAGGLAMMVFGYWLLFVLPPLLLAWKGRWIGVGFALLTLPDVVLVLVLGNLL